VAIYDADCRSFVMANAWVGLWSTRNYYTTSSTQKFQNFSSEISKIQPNYATSISSQTHWVLV